MDYGEIFLNIKGRKKAGNRVYSRHTAGAV
jgi:hypothetical protein